MRLRAGLAVVAMGLALAAAEGQSGIQGYLPAGRIDLVAILPPAPAKGEIRYETDRKVFKAMKRTIGSARWDYAKQDIPSSAADVMRDFSCAAGIALSPDRQPATYRLLARAGVDTARENNLAKDRYKRLRPFLIDKGQICEADPADIGKSFDYPSGHTTRGWTDGLILAELLPARATPILARARSYGESRLICRVHNASAVEAGRIGASATLDVVRTTPAYQSDLAAARSELATPQPQPDATACAREEKIVWPSVFLGLAK
ncbi:phosphatase PAP2 family protein [Sphingomonas sp. BIUV-7]|uniref:Acid phosphatase n=1 Tax=Sphingomonas natans TaxID=3063330 RepID=A0ABT8Y3J2_9SPHN|nr:phosphatase PAP2 family protein [Sphingomonas sp. BIUV-7]MDO6412882.1 phosphatase PAP2 family protein [Sphingomonas sp. BIUV-7]